MATRTRAHGRKPAGVILFRVATETRSYPADDLSGGGAAAEPGRWNKKGESVLYTATSVALATLETVVHVNPTGLPLNKFLVQIVVPPTSYGPRRAPLVRATGQALPNPSAARLFSEVLVEETGYFLESLFGLGRIAEVVGMGLAFVDLQRRLHTRLAQLAVHAHGIAE